VRAVQDVASNLQGFRHKELFFATHNMGLGKSIRAGIDLVLSENPTMIVLEDDLVVSSTFLRFMNSGLEKYRDNLEVASIHGFTYRFASPASSPFFLRGADCLGWATWKNRWNEVVWDPQYLLAEIRDKGLLSDFNLSGAHSYESALRNEVKRGFHSWAIYWHASMFLQNRLTLFPEKSLVEYRGADGSGTHAIAQADFWKTDLSEASHWMWPSAIRESSEMRKELEKFHNSFFPTLPLLKRIQRKLKFLIRRSLNTVCTP
jgi:hypothetical protein